jgi:hypothetical protein
LYKDDKKIRKFKKILLINIWPTYDLPVRTEAGASVILGLLEKSVEDLYWICDPFSILPTFMPLKAEIGLTYLKAEGTLKFKC